MTWEEDLAASYDEQLDEFGVMAHTDEGDFLVIFDEPSSQLMVQRDRNAPSLPLNLALPHAWTKSSNVTNLDRKMTFNVKDKDYLIEDIFPDGSAWVSIELVEDQEGETKSVTEW